jgi:NAD(P)-dependent dehydrogenase (short-subunit alcohol dehydrogenase family)
MTVAIVTGASRGIGEAIAFELASDGYDVACTATSIEHARSVADRISKRFGCQAMPVELRVEAPDEVRAAFKEIQLALGPVGVLVNNAGITNVAALLDADLAVLSRVIDVNLKGVLNASQAAARLMVSTETPGAIVNIGSVGALNGFPGRGAYAASKAGVHHLTRILAIELAQYGIRVNCVAPGFVATDMVRNLAADGTLDLAALQARTPSRSLIAPEEVAQTVAWLATSAPKNITGESILVDGGWTAYGHL